MDRPVWASLTGAHAHLAQGGRIARRYRPEVNVFVAGPDEEPETLTAMAELIRGEPAYVVQAPPIADLPGLTTVMRRAAVQMVFDGAPPAEDDTEIIPLDEAVADEMLALATLTEPGPFRRDTRLMGPFFGVKREGRLAAMAGERMHPPGYAELSGVCTHPDFRGQGLGRRLSAFKTRAILQRGEAPFLHAWKDNLGAIALYEKLGYRQRCDMNVAVFERVKG
uniref:GNAT family N-acetyltransferase n=1 Tax=Altererythrobacter segetis TaxID=1104773 RepID=UPI001A9C90D6|nr:GNAT family N-acetyltransferase [Altererythrobacter segetis]